MCGSPDNLISKTQTVYEQALVHLLELQSVLETLTEVPRLRDVYYPLDAFLESEAELHEQTVTRIKGDVELLLQVAKGVVPSARDTTQQLLQISMLKVTRNFLLATNVVQHCDELHVQFAL